MEILPEGRIMSVKQKYLKDENGETFSPIVGMESVYDNNGNALSTQINDTGWRNFSWVNDAYIGTTQSSYTLNKWRVMNNVLYIMIGAGATAVINTSTETEIARIPITGNTSFNTDSKRIWNGAVGGGGAYGGFLVKQESSYIRINIKPHVSTAGHTAPWFSSFFAIPLDNGYKIV